MEQEVLQSTHRIGKRVTQEQYKRNPQAPLRRRREEGPRRGPMAAIARKNELKKRTRTSRRAWQKSSPEETGKNVAKLRIRV